MGYNTLLDAAALAPTSAISLADMNVDAMAISFYKMFGFPTGMGALIARKSFLNSLVRPWFSGGTVDIVQVPGSIVTMADDVNERFEVWLSIFSHIGRLGNNAAQDGTINYTNLAAVTSGLRLLSKYIAFLPLRLSCLTHYLVTSLSSLRHTRTGTPVVRITSQPPTKKLKYVGEQSDTGSTVSFVFLSVSEFPAYFVYLFRHSSSVLKPEGEMLPLSFVEYAATRSNISLRTGCMCNPGGAAAMLGLEHEMHKVYQGLKQATFEVMLGRELGVVRLSLGLASNFYDVWRVVKFAEEVIGREGALRDILHEWSFGRLEQKHINGEQATI
jgi:molybdenum cofactor sulfurtransferase